MSMSGRNDAVRLARPEPRFELPPPTSSMFPAERRDARNCERLASCWSVGCSDGAWCPAPEFRDVRDRTSLRRVLVQEWAGQINWVAKILVLANIRLGSVMTDIIGLAA